MKWPVKWPIFKYYKTNKNSGIVSLIAFQNGITFENRTILGYLAIQNVSRGLPSKNASKYPKKCILKLGKKFCQFLSNLFSSISSLICKFFKKKDLHIMCFRGPSINFEKKKNLNFWNLMIFFQKLHFRALGGIFWELSLNKSCLESKICIQRHFQQDWSTKSAKKCQKNCSNAKPLNLALSATPWYILTCQIS